MMEQISKRDPAGNCPSGAGKDPVTGLICSMILSGSINIIGIALAPLKNRDRPDKMSTAGENSQRRGFFCPGIAEELPEQNPAAPT